MFSAKGTRVGYADNDPVTHAHALLTGTGTIPTPKPKPKDLEKIGIYAMVAA